MVNQDIDPDVLQEAIEKEFACLRCGNCCKGDGVVQIGEVEADRIAEYLGMSRERFVDRYARAYSRNLWRLKDIQNAETWCIFLTVDEQGLYGCRINDVKPDQCASFPAKWMNPDTETDCAGMRALIVKVRERQESAKSE